MARYASAKIAVAECDVCGFRYRLKELKNLIEKGRDTNIKACPECWNPDQPQLRLGEFPVDDPQALRDPRPDFAGRESSRKIQWGWNPVGDAVNNFNLSPNNLSATGVVGEVTVTTS